MEQWGDGTIPFWLLSLLSNASNASIDGNYTIAAFDDGDSAIWRIDFFGGGVYGLCSLTVA